MLANNTNLIEIGPLLDNAGLGRRDTVHLDGTNVRCEDITMLRANGVTVISECPAGE